MSAEEVSKLTDMGFSYDQAVQALKATNNVEQAISYLFEDPIEVDSEPKKEDKALIKHEDTVSVSNPQDIPNLSEYETGLKHSAVGGNHEYRFEESPSQGGHNMGGSINENLIKDIVSNSRPEEREDDSTPLVVAKKAQFFENYLIPLLVILSQIEHFKALFMSKEGLDYGEDKSWYTFKTGLEVKVPEDLSEKEVSEYKFIIEVQRIVAYLDGLSKRKHVSAVNINRNFPNEFKNDLALKVDELEDFFLKFYKSLEKSTATFFQKDLLANYFDSHVESVSDEVSNGISILSVDNEARSETLHECLNEMFWNDEDTIGEIRFVDVAPVVTIQILGDDRDYSVKSFSISEYFYPEIYSKKYADVVVEMHERRTGTIAKRNDITRELINLNSFEGKQIKHILETSIGQLRNAKENDSADDLKRLSESIANEKEKLSNKLSQANKDYAKNDIKNHENILECIADAGRPKPSPYILQGVIVADTEYVYREGNSKSEENWVYFKQIYTSNMDIYDYRLERFSFDDVQQFIYEIMKDPESSIVLIYSSTEIYQDSKPYEVPEKLRKFFDDDNTQLRSDIEGASSSPQSSAVDSPKVSSHSEPTKESREPADPSKEQPTRSMGSSESESGFKSASQTPDIVEI